MEMEEFIETWLVPFIMLVFVSDVVIANISPTIVNSWLIIPFVALNLLAGIGSCFALYDSAQSMLQKRRKVI